MRDQLVCWGNAVVPACKHRDTWIGRRRGFPQWNCACRNCKYVAAGTAPSWVLSSPASISSARASAPAGTRANPNRLARLGKSEPAAQGLCAHQQCQPHPRQRQPALLRGSGSRLGGYGGRMGIQFAPSEVGSRLLTADQLASREFFLNRLLERRALDFQ